MTQVALNIFFPVDYSHFNLYFLYNPDSTHLWLDNNSWVQSLDTKTGSTAALLKVSNTKKAIALSNGTIILLTVNKIAAWRDNRVTELFSNDTINFAIAEKVNENCQAVGTANELFYFYPTQKKLQPVPYEKALKVRFIFKDKANRLWFTTYGQGLFYLSYCRYSRCRLIIPDIYPLVIA